MNYEFLNKLNIKKTLKKNLFKNSFYIISGTYLNAAFGFFFWILAASLYSKEDFGISVAILSAMTLMSIFPLLGLDQSLIRFFPEGHEKEKLMTSITVVVTSTIIITTIFILNINLFSPNISIIQNIAIPFIAIVIFSAIFTLFSSALISRRNGKGYFIQYLLTGSRIILLAPFVVFGSFGILYSVGLGYLISLILPFLVFIKLGFIGKPTINTNYLKKSLGFSGTNYIITLATLTPYQLLPIIVLNVLGASNVANYYMAFTISSLLFLIPSAFSISLFVEGSQGESLKKNVLYSIIGIFVLLTPLIIILYFFGGLILGFIGKGYVEALDLLRIMIFSSYFMSIYQIFLSIKKVQKDVKSLLLISTLNFLFLIILSYIFMVNFGLNGIGYAYLLSYCLSSVMVIFLIKKENWV